LQPVVSRFASVQGELRREREFDDEVVFADAQITSPPPGPPHTHPRTGRSQPSPGQTSGSRRPPAGALPRTHISAATTRATARRRRTATV